MEPVLLVTGATGFVGSALVPLALERGHPVQALVRPGGTRAGADATGRPAATLHPGDVTDAPSVRAALAAARAFADAARRPLWVVHAAGRIDYRPAGAALSEAVNVGGTRHVLAASREFGADRLCFVSSVVAVGPAPDATVLLDEEAPFAGDALASAYVRTKRAAEELCLAEVDALDVVVVNPAAIFGASPRPSNTARFLARVAGARRVPLAPPGSLSVVDLGDVAAGILAALAAGRRGRRYLLSESTWRLADLFAFVRERVGRPGRVRACHPAAWRALVRAATWLDRLRPLEHPTPEALRLLGHHFRYDARRAREELSWSPRPFVEVLDATLAGLRAAWPEASSTSLEARTAR